MKVGVFDIECDGFKPTKIHVVSVLSDGVMRSSNHHEGMLHYLNQCEVLVAHNCIRFDIPVLERLIGWTVQKTRIVDTLALSWYLFPERASHGLESWGESFGRPKPKIDDWDNLSYEEYKHRCQEDVEINKRLWDKCWEYLLKLYGNEEAAWKLIDYLTFKMQCAADQEKLRWKLDVAKCTEGLEKLSAEKAIKFQELTAAMPKIANTKIVKKPTKMYKLNGQLSEAGKKWVELGGGDAESVEVITGYEDGNPNSHIQIKDWLYSLGWVPETFEYKRNKETNEYRRIPQVYGEDGVCDSVKKLFHKEPKLEVLNGLSILSHRISILKGFLSNVSEDGYIQAQVAGLTNTLRFKHAVLVNLPGIDKPYGELIRGCLIAPEGYELVGSDMAALEDRTKQHYMWNYDPEYVKEMMTPDFDPHIDLAMFAGAMSSEDGKAYKEGVATNMKELKGVRYVYKTVNYACVYGAGGATVGRSAGVDEVAGTRLVEAYWKRNWSVRKIADDCRVKEVFGQKWLYNPVSTFWYTLRHDKDRFSTLNQGTGVFCFDTWLSFVKTKGFPVIGQFHDEFIGLVKRDRREAVSLHIREAMRRTNETLKLNRELDCSIQFGDCYADIH